MKLIVPLTFSIVALTLGFGFYYASRAVGTAFASGPTTIVVVFNGETRHDVARLLRPMSFTVKTGSQNTTLYLRDAVYAGASTGKAKLLTVWVTQAVSDNSLFIPSGDATKQPNEIADALAQNALATQTFAVIPVEVAWANWMLNVTRSGPPVVRGGDAAASQLRTAISMAASTIKQIDTRSVTIPIGLGEVKATTWQPWFNADSIVIQIKPTPAATPASSIPDISPLAGRGGVIIGDEFVNHVLSNEFKDRVFGGKTTTESFHFDEIRVAAHGERRNEQGVLVDNGKFVVSGNYVERPDPDHTTVRVQAELSGPDLKPSRLSAETIVCPTQPQSTLTALDCAQLRLKINGGAALITDRIQTDPNIRPIRPEEVKSLGNFFIGAKALNGTAQIDQIKPVEGSIVLISTFRLFGGHIS